MTTTRRLSIWTILWLAWVCLFLGIEIPAALNKRGGDTLSEHIWWWFSVDGKRRFWLLRRVALAVFWVLGVGAAHFLFEVSALWSVILPGIPFGFFIVWSLNHEGSPEETAVGGIMPFKLSIPTVLAAITAGASAFGAAYNLALGDQVVSQGEWVSVAWATLSAVIGTFYHQKREVWTDERRSVGAGK